MQNFDTFFKHSKGYVDTIMIFSLMRLVQSPLSRSITRGVLINRALCSVRGHKFNKFSVNFRESEKRKGREESGASARVSYWEFVTWPEKSSFGHD